MQHIIEILQKSDHKAQLNSLLNGDYVWNILNNIYVSPDPILGTEMSTESYELTYIC